MTGTQKLGLDKLNHLEDAALLSLLDGELAAPEQKRAEEHLAACWTCRDRQTQLQASIGQFLSFRDTLLPEDIASVPAPVEQFRQRLSRHVAERAAAQSAWSKALEKFRGMTGAFVLSRQAALAAVVVVAVLVVTFTDVLSSTASAETLLRRAESFESAHLPHPDSVQLRSVRMEHISAGRPTQELATLEFASDPSGALYITRDQAASERKSGLLVRTGSQAVDTSKVLPHEGALPAAVERYLEAEQWLPDVSVQEFRKLVSARQSTATSSKRSGNEFEVRYPFAPGHDSGIREARLDMNAKTYEPERVSIVTAEAGEFRFTRVSERSTQRTEEWARVFGEPSLSQSRVHGGQSIAHVVKVSPLTYANSVASEQEVAVAAALHKLGACLGEEIYVFPMSDGTILVQGLVDRVERRDAIRSALRSLTFPVIVQVSTPKEWVGGAALYPPPDQLAAANLPQGTGAAVMIADASGREIPLYDEISRRVAKPGITDQELHQRVASFSNEAVSLSRQALLQTWALRRLDAEFSDRRIAQLPTASRQIAERLRNEHRDAISKLTRRQAELLASLTGHALDAPVAGDRLQDSEALLRLAEQQNQLMRRLFTMSDTADDTQASLNLLLEALHQISR
jgi:hypothetical protein